MNNNNNNNNNGAENIVDAEIIENVQDLNGNGVPDHLEQQPQEQGFNGYQQPQEQGFNGYQQPQEQGFNGYQQPQQQGFNGYQQPQMQPQQQGYNQYQQQTQWMEPEQQQQGYAPQVQNNNLIEGFQKTNAVNLTPAQAEFANNLKNNIQTGDLQTLSTFGVDVQKQLGSFSNTMLENVKGKDTGAIGKELENLMITIGQIDIDEFDDGGKKKPKNFLQRWIKKAQLSAEEFKAKQMTVSAQVGQIANKLTQNQEGLLRDVGSLDQIYAQNENYLAEVDAYVVGLDLKLYELRTVDIPNKEAELQADPNNMLLLQELQDLNNFANSVEKRKDDFIRTKAITVQSLPQIRMIQATSYELCEKINNSIHTVIPLWQNQLSIALTLRNQREAVEAQKAVTKTTNDLLLKNSEMLKMNTLETAKENERGIVEVETLRETQKNLMDTIKGVQQIQLEGSKKRIAAEQEIAKMQEEMGKEMLEIAKSQKDRVVNGNGANDRDYVNLGSKQIGHNPNNPFARQNQNQNQNQNYNQNYNQQGNNFNNFNGQ